MIRLHGNTPVPNFTQQFSSKLTRALIKPEFIGVVEIKLVSFDRFRWPFIPNRTEREEEH